MRHEKVLLTLILSELSLIVLAAVASFALEPSLWPGAGASLAERTAPTTSFLLTGLWIFVSVSTLVAWIGLLCLLHEARVLYIASWVAYLVLSIVRGAAERTAVDSALEMLTAIVGGMVVGVIYFSELRTRFRSFHEATRQGREGAA